MNYILPPFCRRVFFLAMLTGLLTVCFSGCSGEDGPEPPPPASEARRTVLVYMAANNNLGSSGYDSDDLAEMRAAVAAGALGDDARLVVYHSPYGAAPVLTALTPGGADTLATFDRSTPAVSAGRMADVIALTRRHAPALSYGFVVWGHATGWLQDGIADDRISYSFGPDGNSRMNITTLASVLEDAGCFDYLYFDCCYMASVETVYELRHAARYIVGSATELPAGGMDYSTNLSLLADGCESALIESARNTYEHYNAKTGMRRTCTMSVIATAGLEALAEATRAVYSAAATSFPASYEPQRFSDYDVACRYFDLYDYVEALAGDAVTLFDRWKSAFGSVVLYSANTPYLWNSVDLSRHHGLSTYIIKSAADLDQKGYRQLEWYGDVVTALPLLKTLRTR